MVFTLHNSRPRHLPIFLLANVISFIVRIQILVTIFINNFVFHAVTIVPATGFSGGVGGGLGGVFLFANLFKLVNPIFLFVN